MQPLADWTPRQLEWGFNRYTLYRMCAYAYSHGLQSFHCSIHMGSCVVKRETQMFWQDSSIKIFANMSQNSSVVCCLNSNNRGSSTLQKWIHRLINEILSLLFVLGFECCLCQTRSERISRIFSLSCLNCKWSCKPEIIVYVSHAFQSFKSQFSFITLLQTPHIPSVQCIFQCL